MENKIQVNTTARYYSSKNDFSEVKAVWFVFHGYGMRADDFIQRFDVINDDVTLIVALEGFHRFYKRGTRGVIAANWMTSDLRLDDISNIVSYGNEVLNDLESKGLPEDIQIGILGFSQGCPAAFRWASQLEQKIGMLVAWGSDIPSDVYKDINKLRKINDSKVQLIIGDQDEFISSDQVDDFIIDLHDAGVQYDYHTYEGGHELYENSVRYFHARLMDDNLEY